MGALIRTAASTQSLCANNMIQLDPDAKRWTEEAIRDYTSESSLAPPYLKVLAAKYSVLPLSIDWTAFFELRADGAIVLVPTEEPDELPTVEQEERLVNLALYQGSLKYPYLSRLVPTRQPTARDCPHCEGRGKIELPGVEPNIIVCYCGGLGWLPESSSDGIYSIDTRA
jgi:hypothetical protein